MRLRPLCPGSDPIGGPTGRREGSGGPQKGKTVRSRGGLGPSHPRLTKSCQPLPGTRRCESGSAWAEEGRRLARKRLRGDVSAERMKPVDAGRRHAALKPWEPVQHSSHLGEHLLEAGELRPRSGPGPASIPLPVRFSASECPRNASHAFFLRASILRAPFLPQASPRARGCHPRGGGMVCRERPAGPVAGTG